jgi:hypothetical protein
MQFNNVEVRFLQQSHGGMLPITDSMIDSCPSHVMAGILERRAKILGPKFKRFQEETRSPNAPYVATEPSKSNASELF